jgi:hypothetical protein
MDSSFAAEGEGSESRSPREILSSDGEDLDAVRVLWLPVAVETEVEVLGKENPVDWVPADAEKDRPEEDVVESEDRTTIPATGIRTMHRRRLSNP